MTGCHSPYLVLQNLNWMHRSEIENKITNVLLCNDVYNEFVNHFVKLLALSTKLPEWKWNWLLKNEVELAY